VGSRHRVRGPPSARPREPRGSVVAHGARDGRPHPDCARALVRRRRRRAPYGSVRAAQGEAGEPYGFVGNELDAVELGISDFHARPYNARLGIFLAPDPIAVFEPQKTLELPLGLGAYSYAAGNPITLSDPTGLCPQCVSDDLLKRDQEMLRHSDPKVREAGRGVQQVKQELLLSVVPVPGGPAARLAARYAPKAYRLAQAARAAASAKADAVAKAAGAMASRGLEKLKGLFGGGAKKAAEVGAAKQIDDAASAATTVGRRGQQVHFPNPNAPKPRNAPGTVAGRDYSGHAFDRMQERGFVPSVVENAIQTGKATPGASPGTIQHFDPVNKFKVITDAATGRVITVF
jgi:RHS repeat-associated protein